jgi:hypothetical protein
MTKQEQFLWAVQTVILANAVNVASQRELAAKHRHVISATGVLMDVDEALRASELIPETLTAYQAALEFCTFKLNNLRGESPQLPSWFSRP